MGRGGDRIMNPKTVEITWLKPDSSHFHICLKLFNQTEDEAGGRGRFRKAMLAELEGAEWHRNGATGHYTNVGACRDAPREYALRTIMISDTGVAVFEGDWDSDQIK